MLSNSKIKLYQCILWNVLYAIVTTRHRVYFLSQANETHEESKDIRWFNILSELTDTHTTIPIIVSVLLILHYCCCSKQDFDTKESAVCLFTLVTVSHFSKVKFCKKEKKIKLSNWQCDIKGECVSNFNQFVQRNQSLIYKPNNMIK